MREHSRRFSFWRSCVWLAVAALVLAVSPSWAKQKNKKQKDSDTSSSNSTDNSLAGVLPDTPQVEANKINEDIGEMLGAFQVGNTDIMHKYYSDDCTFVQSTFDPPVFGWQNYVALYEREKAAFQGMQMIRRNTNVFVHGDVAWASYQWEFDGMWQGRPFRTQGQTTLVFTKVNGNWLIVHNHTSEVMPKSTGEPAPPATSQTVPQSQPESATAAAKP